MLFGFPYRKKKRIEVSKLLLIGLELPELNSSVDQYHWGNCPEDVNLCYYDSIILVLDSLAGKNLPTDFITRTQLTRKAFGRFLFKSACELIAVGQPSSTFRVGDERLSVSWWAPFVPQVCKGLPGDLKYQGEGFRGLASPDGRAFVTPTEVIPDVELFCRGIHPQTDSLILQEKAVANYSDGRAAALQVSFNTYQAEALSNSKESGFAYWLLPPAELSVDGFLSKMVKHRYGKLVR